MQNSLQDAFVWVQMPRPTEEPTATAGIPLSTRCDMACLRGLRGYRGLGGALGHRLGCTSHAGPAHPWKPRCPRDPARLLPPGRGLRRLAPAGADARSAAAAAGDAEDPEIGGLRGQNLRLLGASFPRRERPGYSSGRPGRGRRSRAARADTARGGAAHGPRGVPEARGAVTEKP